MKKNQRKRAAESPGFDFEGFRLTMGVGIVSAALGLLLGWATWTAPPGESLSMGYTTAQRLARALPHSVQEKLALGLALLFVLFGLFCIFMGLRIVVSYWWERMGGEDES